MPLALRRLQSDCLQSYKSLRRNLYVWFLASVAILVVLALFVIAFELRTSHLQSKYLSRFAAGLTWEVSTRSGHVLESPQGPYDKRQGYALLPRLRHTLQRRGFRIEKQSIVSDRLYQLAAWGIAPPFDEKPAGALQVYDDKRNVLYRATTDEFHFRQFIDLPPLIVASLLHVENRELLDEARPMLNPALDWDRLAFAGWSLAMDRVFGDRQLAGGSTLATQLQKFRHSKYGRTTSLRDKLQQMIGASVSAYRLGEDTRQTRQRLVMDYLNSMPLGARHGFGEVTGLGDGMWSWYGKTPQDLAIDLSLPEEGELLSRKAKTFKQALSLILATRRPAWYLGEDERPVERRLQFYLSNLERAGVISPQLATRARQAELHKRASSPPRPATAFTDGKAEKHIRTDLLNLLGLSSFYDLDRMDLAVETTIDVETQKAVNAVMAQLQDPEFLRKNGFYGDRLLSEDDDPEVIYMFSLYEAGEHGNKLLVNADNYQGALDLNHGTKLEMGSTAKLRTVAGYLGIMADLYERHSGRPDKELRELRRSAPDPMTRWMAEATLRYPNFSMEQILEKSLDRKISTAANVSFFTGGGTHRFDNFGRTYGTAIKIRTAMHHSVNLVFIRIMREMIDYYIAELGYDQAMILEETNHPQRTELLKAGIDHESREYLLRFYQDYADRNGQQALQKLIGSDRGALRRLAIFQTYLHPNRTSADLQEVATRCFGELDKQELAKLQKLHARFSAREYDLSDIGWLMKKHPLEVWLVVDRLRYNENSWSEVVERSYRARHESYQWLTRGKSRKAQNLRIRAQLERLAFERVHAQWRRFGYPFDSLVPSLATAIGSSADRPEALTALMGIIQNDGLALPTRDIEALHFAKDTPYEVRFVPDPRPAERVMPSEMATVLRNLLRGVVNRGTARRVRGMWVDSEDGLIALGGKTGSGDNRFKRFDKHGNLIESRPINRTASFVFFIGEKHFGTVLAYVPGEAAGDYSFTSSLALQVFRALSGAITPLVRGPQSVAASGPPASLGLAP